MLYFSIDIEEQGFASISSNLSKDYLFSNIVVMNNLSMFDIT